MNWAYTLLKVAGSATPLTAPLVQLLADIEGNAVQKRVERIEDPISALHEDIPEVSGLIYSAIKEANDEAFKLTDETYRRFRRSLAILESRGYIKCAHRLGSDVPLRIVVSDSAYLILYVCARFEEGDRMQRLVELVDACAPGRWLDGKEIAAEIDIPVPVVRACFNLYQSKGLGICSREVGQVRYVGRA